MAITNYLVHFKTEATYESNKDQLRNDAVAFVKDATIIHTHGTDYYCGSSPVALESDLANYATTEALTSGLADKADVSHTHTISQISGLQGELDSKLESVSLADLGVTATATELNYVDGVTSNIQTQLNNKAASSHEHAASAITSGTLSLDRLPSITDAKITSISASKITGTIPQANLPSYVDDVLEYSSKSSFPQTGEAGKIYVDTTTNLTYRWGGSSYVEISPSLALGETSSTAYRGDRGKIAYDHSQATGNPHGLTLSNLGISATAAELNYMDGVTSNVQTQLNGKAASSHSHSNYLQKSGDTMSGDITMTGHALVWHDQTAYDDVPTGLMGVSVVNDSALGYSTCISFKNYYGLQIAANGDANEFYIRGHNHTQWNSWYELLHSGNIGSFALTPSNYTATLDGRYVKKSGDTMTGILTAPGYYGNYLRDESAGEFYVGSATMGLGTTAGLQLATYGNLPTVVTSNGVIRLTIDSNGAYWANQYPLLHTNNYASYLDSRYARTAYDNNLINRTNEFNFIPSGYSSHIAINCRTQGGLNGNVSEYRFYNGSGRLSDIVASAVTANATFSTPSICVYDTMSTMAKKLTLNWASSMARIYAIANDGNTIQDLILGSTNASTALYYNASTARWGIGTALPSEKLHIVGGLRCTGWLRTEGEVGWYSQTYSGGIYMSDSTYVRVYNNKAFYVSNNIVSTGQVSATNGFYETSDARLKNFKDDIKALDVISEIPTKYFTWKEDKNQELQIGTSAQEIEKLYPELVSKTDDDVLTVDYAKLSIVALAAIKELKAEIQFLKKKLNN